MDVWANPEAAGDPPPFRGAPGSPGRACDVDHRRRGADLGGHDSRDCHRQGSLVTRVVAGSALPSPLVRDLAIDGRGRVWAATVGGVAVLDPDDGSVLEVYDDERAPGIVDERVNALAVELETASIWFATETGLSRHTYDQGCSGVVAADGDGCTRFCPYPNPFDPGRAGALYLTGAGNDPGLEITILDAAGREVRRVSPAADGAVWDGLDDRGEPVASGVYLLRVAAAGIDPAHVRRVAVRR